MCIRDSLLDSGWLSAVVYRAGLIPRNPSIACDWATYFYGVHFSPILSVFSLLSYLVPLPRIEWYAVVQGLIYVPIGIAVYCVWASGRRPWRSRSGRRSTPERRRTTRSE